MKGCPDRLRACLPRSVAARGVVMLLLAAGSVALPGYFAYRTIASYHQARQQYEREMLLAATLGAYLEVIPAVQDDDQAWVQRMVERGDRLRWAGLFRRDGRGLEFKRRTALPTDEILSQIDLTCDTPTTAPLRIDGVVSTRFELMTIPVRDEDAVLALILDRGLGALPVRVAQLWVVLWIGAGILGLVLTWVWFRYAIEWPIHTIRRRVAAIQAGLRDVTLGDHLPEELTGLARSAQALQKEVDQWRTEARYLRHSVETAVDLRTRKASKAQRRAEREADTDALTRLGNRRMLERELPALFEQSRGRGGDLSVLVFDVDHFKQMNDAYGHQAGDVLLAFLGELIRGSVRRGVDLAVRLGGDEFLLALPNTGINDAREIGRRLATLFAQRTRTFDGVAQPPTLSFGVASVRQDRVGTWEDLVRLADETMYAAKQAGRLR